MDDFNYRRKRKTNYYPKAIIIVLFVILILLIRANWSVYTKNRDTKDNLDLTQQNFQELEYRKKNLDEEINSLNTEKGVEAEIRSKFRVVKNEEEMILLIDSPDATSTINNENTKSFWSRLLNFFNF